MAVDKKGRKLPKGIRQRGDIYEGRFTYRYQTYTVYGKTITETQKALTDLKYKLEHGLFVAKDKVTLDEWFDTWMEEYKKNQVKIGTYTGYQKYYDAMIRKRIGGKYINDIRGEHIQKLYNDYVKEGYAVSTIKVVAAVLSGSMKQAMKNGLIERNPVELAILPRQTGKRKIKAMTKEQQALFMEYAKESYLYNLYAVLLRTGMRSGEARGLKYTDIDKKAKVIHIRRTLKYIEGMGYIEDTPKTASSTRDIPLTAATLELLEAQKNYWGFKVEKIDRYLFCNEEGDPLSRDRTEAEFARIIKRIRAAGYCDYPWFTPHSLRHTFATRAIEAGMLPQVLKTILGHSSLAMTMDLYSHVLPDEKGKAMEMIEGAF